MKNTLSRFPCSFYIKSQNFQWLVYVTQKIFPLLLYTMPGRYEIPIPIEARNIVLFPKRLNVLWRTSATSSVDSGVLSGLNQKGGEDG